MNNVFRLIWNRTLGRLVVASEAARSRDKAATQQGVVGQLSALEVVGGTGVSTLLRPVALAVAIATGSLVVQPVQANIINTVGVCTMTGGGISCRPNKPRDYECPGAGWFWYLLFGIWL